MRKGQKKDEKGKEGAKDEKHRIDRRYVSKEGRNERRNEGRQRKRKEGREVSTYGIVERKNAEREEN